MRDDPSSIMSGKLSTPRDDIAGKNTDDINRHNSYGENNHRNSTPHFYGENNHLQNSSYHGDTNHRNIGQRNYNHISYGDNNHPRLNNTNCPSSYRDKKHHSTFDERNRHSSIGDINHQQNFSSSNEYVTPTRICNDNSLKDYKNNLSLQYSGEKNHLYASKQYSNDHYYSSEDHHGERTHHTSFPNKSFHFDERNHHYTYMGDINHQSRRHDDNNHQKPSTHFGDIDHHLHSSIQAHHHEDTNTKNTLYHQNCSNPFARNPNTINPFTSTSIDSPRNLGTLNANRHSFHDQKLMVDKAKTKRPTISNIQNTRPTKKAHEQISEYNDYQPFGSDLYPKYHPVMVKYPIGIYNPMINRNTIPRKYHEHVLGIQQGILFDQTTMFVFSPILQKDIVSNLMSVIHREVNCHISLLQIDTEKSKKKQLKREILAVANQIMRTPSFGAIDCRKYLEDRGFLEKNFTKESTFDLLLDRLETIRLMVYYKMPIQRLSFPGKNCFWIKEMTNQEIVIIQDHRLKMSCEKFDSYFIQVINQEKESPTSSLKDLDTDSSESQVPPVCKTSENETPVIESLLDDVEKDSVTAILEKEVLIVDNSADKEQTKVDTIQEHNHIPTKVPAIIETGYLNRQGFDADEVDMISSTILQLQKNNWYQSNQLQSETMGLLQKVDLVRNDLYLPKTYWTSEKYNQVLIEKKFPVIKSIFLDIPEWISKQEKRNPEFRPPPKSFILSYIYVLAYKLLWDSGYQRQVFVQQENDKGKDLEVHNVFNCCPCHKFFKTIWDSFEFLHHKYESQSYSIPCCDCTGGDNTLFYTQMMVKGKLCIYHHIAYLYLRKMYSDSMRIENEKIITDNEDIEEIEVIEENEVMEDENGIMGIKYTINHRGSAPIPRKQKLKSNKSLSVKTTKNKKSTPKTLKVKQNNTSLAQRKKTPPNKKTTNVKQKQTSSLIEVSKQKSPMNKTKKNPLSNFPKIIERCVYTHSQWKQQEYDHLYEIPNYTGRQKKIYSSKPILKYDCTVTPDEAEWIFEGGKYCDEFDRISRLVGSPTIKDHKKDELLPSYFKKEALHLLSPDNVELCFHVIGFTLKRYMITHVRETSTKVGQSNLGKDDYDNVDCRYNKSEDIEQDRLLQHFISAVVVLNPVWDIGIQNIMVKSKYLDYVGTNVDNLTMKMQCPCSKRFRKWRKSYLDEEYTYHYPIDDDKVGFKECNSCEFTNIIEFYKHLTEWESRCYYHEAMIDILHVLYPGLYSLVIDPKKHPKLLELQGLSTKKKQKVGYQIILTKSLFCSFTIAR